MGLVIPSHTDGKEVRGLCVTRATAAWPVPEM